MRRLVFALALVVGLVGASVASAATQLPKNQWLRYQGTGAHVWTHAGQDSPNDTNGKALSITVGDPALGQYSVAFSRRSLHLSLDVNDVTNLSFEYSREAGDHVGAGAPRISLQFQNGDIGYLSAFYCDHPMAITGGTFGRADFTRFRSNCSFFVTGDTGGQYFADGSRDAFQVYAEANPAQVVEQAYFVADEAGHYQIDRLSLGAGVVYSRANRYGKTCTTEASC